MKLEGKTVLVTGCTGFLGGHLVKRLVQFKRTRVRGLIIPTLSSTRQFDGMPVEKVFGDITSIMDMREATHGCDIVVHCAIGEPNVTVSGTRNAIKAAVEHQVKRFIHISSTAVFGYSPLLEEAKDGRLQGSYHKNKNNHLNPYCYSKIASEKIAFSYYDSNKLPLVILRPSNIFGPNSRWWTTAPIKMLEQGRCVLVDGGLSPSNSVYVDNVVNAIELAIQEDDAVGHALTISSDKAKSWKDFFSSYARMFPDPPPLLNISSKDLKKEKRRRHLKLLKKMLLDPKQTPSILPRLANQSSFVSMIVTLARNLPIREKINALNPSATRKPSDLAPIEEVTDNTSSLDKLPELWLEKTFTIPFHFSIKGAAEILGFKPQVTFEEGMKKTEKWLRDSGVTVYTAPFETSIIPELNVAQNFTRARTKVS